jgi:hypothetical protein
VVSKLLDNLFAVCATTDKIVPCNGLKRWNSFERFVPICFEYWDLLVFKTDVFGEFTAVGTVPLFIFRPHKEHISASGAGIKTLIGCHTFWATGITAYLSNGGKLEVAQQMAAHESARTTSLYDRRGDDISLDEVERIAI